MGAQSPGSQTEQHLGSTEGQGCNPSNRKVEDSPTVLGVLRRRDKASRMG
jgi:hypothetical protein